MQKDRAGLVVQDPRFDDRQSWVGRCRYSMGREKAKSKMQGGRVAAVILLGFLMFLKTMAGTLLHHDGSSQLHIMVSQVRKMVKSWTRQYW